MRKFPITTSIKNVKPVKRIKFSSVSKLKKLYTWLKYLFSLIKKLSHEGIKINEIKEILSTKGETTVNLIIKNKILF